jgi:hypothetical protein
MKRLAIASSAFLMTGWFGGSVGVASSGRLADLPERVRDAHAVVVATAVDVRARWDRNAAGDRVIVSRISLRVDETLKGDGYESRFVDIEGGTVGDVTLHVSSIPEFKPGDRGVFLLDETGTPVDAPHLRGLGLLKLGRDNRIAGTPLGLDDIRGMALASR